MGDPLRMGPRITLFDAEKQYLAGNPEPIDTISLRPITVLGEIVGWLGLTKGRKLTHPLDRDFLQKQTKAYYLIGGVIILVSVFVAFFLSRHLLTPVRKLAEGTHTLADRKFDTRIDVTSSDELGELAGHFNTMAIQLESYEKMQAQWLSDISHELRTPLSVLIGEIEALQDGIRKPNPEAFSSLHTEATYLADTVNRLHDLSLAESSALSMKSTPINPLDVFLGVIDRFKTHLEHNLLSVSADLECDKPIRVMGDTGRLAQVCINLVENALRYTDRPGTLHIHYRLEKGRLAISFEDTGPGVPENMLERLFDRLFRVDSARSREKGGSGLGLSICKSIIEHHDGFIGASKGKFGGLRFDIELPVIQRRVG